MKKTITLFSVLVCTFLSCNISGQIVINEISNADTLQDENGSGQENWLELYNTTSGSINLSGYFLSDKHSQPDLWAIPAAANIPANGFLRIFCDGKDRTGNTAYLHTNFKISRQGEMIYLANSTSIIDSIDPGNLEPYNSFGRKPDGSLTMGVFTTLTPGASNNSQTLYTDYAAEPSFATTPGFYPSTTSVTINVPAGTNVYYTTDGGIPTTGSTHYTTPFNVASTQAIKAKAFPISGTVLPSKMITGTYFINETGLGNLPVISLSLPPADFTEVYYNTVFNPWGPASGDYFPIRKAHIEYFDKTQNPLFETDIDFQLMGHYSIYNADEYSMKLTCSGNYNDPKINQTLFRDRPTVTSVKGIELRSEYNGKSLWDGFSAPLLIKKTQVDVAAYEPCIVYCNGQYWGEYQLRELATSEWVNHNFGISKDSIDFLHQAMKTTAYNELVEALSGSDTGFVNLRTYMVNNSAPNSNAYYDYVSSKIDVENYTDYFAYQTYMANWDWFCEGHLNNIKLWRKQGTGDHTKWRYFIYDMDYFGGNFLGYNFNALGWVRTPCTPNIHSDIFNRFMANDSLKNYFVDRYADLMNTIFQPADFNTRLFSYRDSSLVPMIRHWLRWPHPYGGNSTYSDWLNNFDMNIGIPSWEVQRLPIARSQLQSQFNLAGQVNVTLDVVPAGAGRIKISTITPDGLPWTGVYYHGVPVRITAIPNPGYTFAYWGANNTTAQNTNASIYYDIAVNDVFTAHFTGATIDPHFTFSEINYNPVAGTGAGDWVEIHSYENQPINLTGWYLKDMDNNHRFDIPFGTVLQPNGYLVVSCDTVKFKMRHPSVLNFVGQPSFSFSNNGDQIRLFDFHDNLKLTVTYDDALPWPQGANGGGKTLELADSSNLNVATSWFDGCINGSPGTAYVPCAASVKENSKNNDQVIVYPNPFTTNATIKIYSNATNQIFILYDELGKQVKKLKVKNSKVDIDKGNLNNGIYFYRVTSDQGIVGKGKIIIE